MPDVDVKEFVEGFKAIHDEFAKRFDAQRKDMQSQQDRLLEGVREEYEFKLKAMEDCYRERIEEMTKEFDARVELVKELLSGMARTETKEIEYDQYNRPKMIRTKRD